LFGGVAASASGRGQPFLGGEAVNFHVPTWLWVLVLICLVVLVGNVIHLWTIHFQFAF
jgi:hypothetical protein